MRCKLALCFFVFTQFLFAQSQKIPIFAYHGIPATHSTAEQYQTMRNVGIDICYTVFVNDNDALKALNAAQKVGAKLVIRVPGLFDNTKVTVNKFKAHPALFGYYLADEPSPDALPELQKLAAIIKSVDTVHQLYINLFPSFVSSKSINGLSYENYVSDFAKKIPVSFISFDNYPLVNNQIRGDWYQNLEVIRKESIESKKPFWAFACSTIHYGYLQPTIAGIKLQQYSNLLYGAKGIQYFTYWTLTYEDNWVKEKYGYSIVDDMGKPTPTYNVIKTVNVEIQKIAWVFMNSKVDSIFHAGDAIPIGTKKMDFLPKKFKKFNVSDSKALISFLSDGSKKYTIIQNKDIFKPMILSCQLQSGVSVVTKEGKTIATSTKEKKYKILPGDILIFSYNG